MSRAGRMLPGGGPAFGRGGGTPAPLGSMSGARTAGVMRSEAVKLLAHHDWHLAKERHPSAQ